MGFVEDYRKLNPEAQFSVLNENAVPFFQSLFDHINSWQATGLPLPKIFARTNGKLSVQHDFSWCRNDAELISNKRTNDLLEAIQSIPDLLAGLSPNGQNSTDVKTKFDHLSRENYIPHGCKKYFDDARAAMKRAGIFS